jgi:hypothetical protein
MVWHPGGHTPLIYASDQQRILCSTQQPSWLPSRGDNSLGLLALSRHVVLERDNGLRSLHLAECGQYRPAVSSPLWSTQLSSRRSLNIAIKWLAILLCVHDACRSRLGLKTG